MAFAVRRAGAVLAGGWGGVLVAIGLIAAPAAFAVAARDVAGRLAGRLFEQEAYLSLGVAVVLLGIVRRRRGVSSLQAGTGSALTAEVGLVLLTLFCTVAGHFALLPMIDAARAGRGALSFGMLHALSAGLYAVKTLAVLALAWRLSAVGVAGPGVRRDGDAPVSRQPSS